MIRALAFGAWLALVLYMSGCASPPPVVDARTRFVVERIQRARSLEYRGDLAAALEQWRVVLSVDPDDGEIVARIGDLEKGIAERARQRYQEGVKLLAQGEQAEAERWLLASLALAPRGVEPLDRLREMEQHRVRRVQLATLRRYGDRRVDAQSLAAGGIARPPAAVANASEVERSRAEPQTGGSEAGPTALERYLTANPGDTKGRTVMAAAQQVLVRRNIERQQFTEALYHLQQLREYSPGYDPALEREIVAVKAKLAEQLYSEGVRVFGTDLNQAIEYWELVLSYDPGHGRARLRLREAYEIKGE